MDWYNDITMSDIPCGTISDIALKNGIKDAVSLMKHVPGLQLYIPVYGKKKIQSDFIKENYTGKNLLSIAVKLGMDTKRVLYFIKRFANFKRPAKSNNYMQIVAYKCGNDVAIRLIDKFAGEKIYIPINGYTIIRKRKIIDEFNGKNTTELALKYHVSERYISKIISDSYRNSNVIQLDLFAKHA